jgi:DNA-binding NarL/FixJ family response regulator
MNMIRIFLIEDHNVTIAGLRTFFRPSRDPVSIVLTAASIEDALQIKESESFDIILLDLWLPESEPSENFKRVSAKFPGKPIIIYSAERAIRWQRIMYKLGARGFINKDADKSLIKDTLERVIKGETVYSAGMDDYQSKRMIKGYQDPRFGLTDEQKTVLKYFMEGMGPKYIGKEIGRDHSTINKTLSRIRDVFKVDNNIELIKVVLSLDIEESDPADQANMVNP